jgi:hypothetical protein
MRSRDALPEFPARFRASTARATQWYARLSGSFALHGPVPPSLAPTVAFLLDDGAIAICRGEPEAALALAGSVPVTPVYALEGGGPPAVPTGQVFIRFAESVSIAERRQAVARAGFTVVETLPYAPHAAWVRATDGGIAAALAAIPALEGLPDIVNVEPQLLLKRAPR